MWRPEDYHYCIDQDKPWHMDALHISQLEAVLYGANPSRVMEIGSFMGFSTSMFVDALNRGLNFELHLVEPQLLPSLSKLINSCARRQNIVLHKAMSHEVDLDCDFVLIDGHHEWPALHDLARALANNTKVIALHDTKTYLHGVRDCWGAFEAANILRNAKGRRFKEDYEKRENMRTERGFMASIAE